MVSAYNIHYMGLYGVWYGFLPKGCIYCMKGSKAVIFITGICGTRCYYCPISFERRSHNSFYIDEERFRNFSELIDEIALIKAEGASITGGEPFQMFHMVLNLIKSLKEIFGDGFHIHLYTSGYGVTKEAIRRIASAGLNEIRFHIVNNTIFKLIEFTIKETDMDVGIEIPAIPDMEWLWRIAVEANNLGVKFINLNEFEASETNIENLLIRGYKVRDDGRSIEGSYEIALKVIEKVYKENMKISIHLCPAIYKDVIQHKNRLRRKALMCLGPGISVNDDGTVKISN
ncbi:MAG: radical SAM protein, partial [Ignisphaera sp.]